MRKACFLNSHGVTVGEVAECDGNIDWLAMHHVEGNDIVLEWPDGRKDTYHTVMRVEIVEAHEEPGYAAAMSGLGPSANPYQLNSPQWRDWNRHYIWAQGSALMNPRYAEAKREADGRIAALKEQVDERTAAMRALLEEMSTLERDMHLEDVRKAESAIDNAIGIWTDETKMTITIPWRALQL